ncbi:zinc ribbon domain-containing protein [Mycolicibacterium sp. YH-1]|uniref:zinc ribbon domain-containing protein n=1 Tax=Mycolicibacterium sp. YH-1 TaxID=2908837 RepID=UPI001F4BF0D8|nr:zinc ribbon domain-containing protein [Mycolicibacterium sp. YH-1]UNB51226.1 zinc ribbon domain-containing protein [Mycolicibacterium sp. YH-1]
MSTQSEPNDPERPTMECSVCQMDVPAGQFCGYCGDYLEDHPRSGPKWLRMRAFSASPGEHLLTPNLASSLFPQLPPASRKVFLLGLGLLLVALIAATWFKLPAVLITVAALGLPLLFLIYLQEADAHRDIPSATLVITAALGIGLGVGWVLLTGAAMARSYGVPLGAGISATRIVRDGLGIPVGGMLLMLVPAALVRLFRPGPRESLDGFALGALGALMFTGAATLTRLAPQFTTGMIARARPMDGLMVEAGIRGVAVPLTAACVGGLMGAALWFTRPANKKEKGRTYVRLVLVILALAVMAMYAGLGLVDVARVPQFLQLAVHLTIAVIALLALRIGLHLALLHEAHDEVREDEPILCPFCGHVVPDMAFCPACGAATHAASRSSRQIRRDQRPVRIDSGTTPETDDR